MYPTHITLKPEFLQKGKEHKKRVVQNSFITTVMNMKRLCQPVASAFNAMGPKSPYALSIAPRSEWHFLIQDLTDHGSFFVDLDFKSFDLTITDSIIKAAMIYVAEFYSDHPQYADLRAAAEVYGENIAYDPILVGDSLISKQGGVASGIESTSFIDAICARLTLYAILCIRKSNSPIDLEILPASTFADIVKTKSCGDDFLLCFSQGNEIDYDELEEAYHQVFGMMTTNGAKNDEANTDHDLWGTSFVSRNTIRIKDSQFYHGRLKACAVATQLVFSKSNDTTEQLRQLEAARLEVYYYGKEAYDQLASDIVAFSQYHGLKHVVVPYQEMTKAITDEIKLTQSRLNGKQKNNSSVEKELSERAESINCELSKLIKLATPTFKLPQLKELIKPPKATQEMADSTITNKALIRAWAVNYNATPGGIPLRKCQLNTEEPDESNTQTFSYQKTSYILPRTFTAMAFHYIKGLATFADVEGLAALSTEDKRDGLVKAITAARVLQYSRDEYKTNSDFILNPADANIVCSQKITIGVVQNVQPGCPDPCVENHSGAVDFFREAFPYTFRAVALIHNEQYVAQWSVNLNHDGSADQYNAYAAQRFRDRLEPACPDVDIQHVHKLQIWAPTMLNCWAFHCVPRRQLSRFTDPDLVCDADDADSYRLYSCDLSASFKLQMDTKAPSGEAHQSNSMDASGTSSAPMGGGTASAAGPDGGQSAPATAIDNLVLASADQNVDGLGATLGGPGRAGATLLTQTGGIVGDQDIIQIGIAENAISFAYKPQYVRTVQFDTETDSGYSIASIPIDPWSSALCHKDLLRWAQLHKRFLGGFHVSGQITTTPGIYGNVQAALVPPQYADTPISELELSRFQPIDIGLSQEGRFSVTLRPINPTATKLLFIEKDDAMPLKGKWGRIVFYTATKLGNIYATQVPIVLRFYTALTEDAHYFQVDVDKKEADAEPIPPLQFDLEDTLITDGASSYPIKGVGEPITSYGTDTEPQFTVGWDNPIPVDRKQVDLPLSYELEGWSQLTDADYPRYGNGPLDMVVRHDKTFNGSEPGAINNVSRIATDRNTLKGVGLGQVYYKNDTFGSYQNGGPKYGPRTAAIKTDGLRISPQRVDGKYIAPAILTAEVINFGKDPSKPRKHVAADVLLKEGQSWPLMPTINTYVGGPDGSLYKGNARMPSKTETVAVNYSETVRDYIKELKGDDTALVSVSVDDARNIMTVDDSNLYVVQGYVSKDPYMPANWQLVKIVGKTERVPGVISGVAGHTIPMTQKDSLNMKALQRYFISNPGVNSVIYQLSASDGTPVARILANESGLFVRTGGGPKDSYVIFKQAPATCKQTVTISGAKWPNPATTLPAAYVTRQITTSGFYRKGSATGFFRDHTDASKRQIVQGHAIDDYKGGLSAFALDLSGTGQVQATIAAAIGGGIFSGLGSGLSSIADMRQQNRFFDANMKLGYEKLTTQKALQMSANAQSEKNIKLKIGGAAAVANANSGTRARQNNAYTATKMPTGPGNQIGTSQPIRINSNASTGE